MNDQELVNLLLDNYHRQLQCFKQILNDSECELKIISTVEKSDDINKKAEVIKGHVELLKKRGSLLDQIKEIDVEIKGNKIGWDRRKNDVDFEELCRHLQLHSDRIWVAPVAEVARRILDWRCAQFL